jgi:hypothetical protein
VLPIAKGRRRATADVGAAAITIAALMVIAAPQTRADRITPPAAATEGVGQGGGEQGGAGLSDEAIDERLQFLEDRLDGSRTHGQIWYWSWMAIDGGSAVGLGIAAGLANHEDDQLNNGVQAGVSVIGVGDLLLRPLEARFGADPVRALPEQTREEKLAKLHAAEDLLRGNAARADERTSWVMHAGNVALNAAAGGIIAGFGRPSDGLIAFATGTVGGVINILTAPWEPATDWQDYKARFGGGTPSHEQVSLTLRPLPDRGAMLALRYQW